MASITKIPLQIVSFNMHGFNQGQSTLEHLCSTHIYDVTFVQEHWLSPDKVNQILSFSPLYIGYGISAMEKKLSCGPLVGRPFGGSAILVRKDLSKMINNILCGDRFVIVFINDLAVVNVYMPCKSNLSSDEYSSILNDTLEQISGQLHLVKPEFIIVAGDFNTDLRVVSLASDTILDFANEFNLFECSRVMKPANIDFTYHSLATGHHTWIDFFLVSDSLRSDIVDLDILEIPFNLSDHLAIHLNVNVTYRPSDIFVNPGIAPINVDVKKQTARLRWDKANTNLFYEQTRIQSQSLLDELRPMYDKIIKSDSARIINGICRCTHATTFDICDCCTTNITCEYLIDKYYTQVVDTLIESVIATVPIVQQGTEKHWWSHEQF